MMSSPTSGLRAFHPGWSGLALGTSGVAVAGLVDPWPGTDVDRRLGSVVAGVAIVATITMFAVTVVRMFRHPDAVRDDLRHPVNGALLGTSPASLIVLALVVAQLGILGSVSAGVAAPVATALVVGGVIASLGLGMSFFAGVVGHHELPIQMISGVWFVPVVVLVIVPSVMVRVLALSSALHEPTVEALSLAAWGAGILLFVFLGAIVGWRLITQPPPPAQMIASWFIWLAPASAGALGFVAAVRMLQVDVADGVAAVELAVRVVTTAMWGFAVWWLAFALLQVSRHRREMHFNVGSWGFAFPLGAFVALGAELSRLWDVDVFSVVAVAVWIVLMVVWAWLMARSVRMLVSRP